MSLTRTWNGNEWVWEGSEDNSLFNGNNPIINNPIGAGPNLGGQAGNPPSGGSTGAPPPAGGNTPPAVGGPNLNNPTPPRVDPMTYFRQDFGNPNQHSSTAGQSFLSGLMPGITFGTTAVQGPNAPNPQSVFHVNGQGQAYNTGLNIANALQYGAGSELFRRMVEDERRYNAGSQLGPGNDASLTGYTGYTGAPYVAGSAVSTPPPNTYNANNYTSPTNLQAARAASNTTVVPSNPAINNAFGSATTPMASTGGTIPPPSGNAANSPSSQQGGNSLMNFLLPLLLMGGGQSGLGTLLALLSLAGGGSGSGNGLGSLFGANAGTGANRNSGLYGLFY